MSDRVYLWIKMPAGSGMVEDIIKDAYRLAVQMNVGVEFYIHDIKIIVTPNDDVEKVFKNYMHKVNSK